jgi:hypothetical protein
MIKTIIPLSVLLILSTNGYSAAEIVPAVSFLSEKSPSIQLTVINKSNHKAYITPEATLYQCKTPGLMECDPSELETNKEAADELTQHLRFSKPRFILAKGQKRVIFLSWKGAFPEHPTTFHLIAEDSAPNDLIKAKKQQINERIAIQYNYKVKYLSSVMILPKSSKFMPPDVSKQGKELILKNPGTSQIYLLANQECTESASCLSFRNTLLPKQTVSLPITQPGKITINYLDMNSSLQRQYKTITLE